MISTRDLSALAGIDQLRQLSQSLAMLDAILSPQWQYRYYSFNRKWSRGQMLAAMRNGCGDDYHLLFTRQGAILKGFAHESKMSPYGRADKKPWPGIFEQVPKEFKTFLTQPAFAINDTTFCIWRRYKDPAWTVGPVEFPGKPDDYNIDGSATLLSILDGDPQRYKDWTEGYYEDASVPLTVVEQIYRHAPLTEQLVAELNPKVTLAELAEDIAEIGYPVS